MNIGIRPGLTLITLVLLTACQSTEEMDDSRALRNQPISTDGLENGCFFVRDVNNFEIVSRVNLVVYAPGRSRAFLLQISPPAIGVQSAFGIAFIDRRPQDRICGRPGERLSFDRGSPTTIYNIVDVRRLTEEQLDAILPRKQSIKPVSPVPESPGAEVEIDVTPDENAAVPEDEAGNLSE